MDSNLVEWSEEAPTELKNMLSDLYSKYKEVHIGKPMEEIDFNGCMYIISTFYWYINKVNDGVIPENPKLPLDKTEHDFLEYCDKIHLDKIM